MSELNVGGIRSSLELDLSKWTGRIRTAASDAQNIGKSIEAGITAASKIAASAMSSLGGELAVTTRAMHDNLAVGMSIGDELRTLRTESNAFGAASLSAFGDLRILLNAVDENLHTLTRHMTQAATAARSIQPPPLPPPTQVTNWAAGLRSLAGVAGMINPQMGQLASGFMAAEGAAMAAGVGIGTMLAPLAAVAAAAAAIKSAFTIAFDGIALATQSARTDILLTSFLGSAEGAASLRAELAALSDQSVISTQEINDSAAKMLSYGISANEVTGTLAQLSDIAAGVNRPLSGIVAVYGQVLQKGQLYSEEVQQFAEQGIPLLVELAKVFGVSTAEMKELIDQGVVGFPAVKAAIASMTGETGDFHEINKKVADELPWLMIAKQWENVRREIGKSIIMNLDLASIAKEVINVIKAAGPVLVEVFSVASQVYRNLMSGFAPVVDLFKELSGVWGDLQAGFADMGIKLPELGDLFKGAMQAMVLPTKVLVETIGAIAAGIGWAIDKARMLAVELAKVAEKLADLEWFYNPGGKLVKSVTGVTTNRSSSGSDAATPEANTPGARPTPGQPAATAVPGAGQAGGRSGGNGSGGGGGPETDAEKAEKARVASRERADQLAWENFISGLRLRGANELADYQDRRHKAELEMAKAKTEEERRQIAVAMEMDLAKIRQKSDQQRVQERDRETDKAAGETQRIAAMRVQTEIQNLRNADRDEEADRLQASHNAQMAMAKAKSDEERRSIDANLQANLGSIRKRYDEQRARDDERIKRESEREAKKNGGRSINTAPSLDDLKDSARRERDPSKRTLAQLDLRESLGHTLGQFDKDRQERLRDRTGIETLPALASNDGRGRFETLPQRINDRVNQRVERFNQGRAGGGGGASGAPNINVNAPAIPVADLARAIAANLTPLIDQRIAAAERASKLAGYGAAVAGGL